MLHGIKHKDSGQHQPQGIHEDKVKPEVEGVAQLPVLESVPLLRQEVQHVPVDLAHRHHELEDKAEGAGGERRSPPTG